MTVSKYIMVQLSSVWLSSVKGHSSPLPWWFPSSLVLRPSCTGGVTQDRAWFLGFRSSALGSSGQVGEKRSGSSGPHLHTCHQMLCCTILEIFPCDKNRKESMLINAMFVKSLTMSTWRHLKSAHTWDPLWRYVWAWSSQSHRAQGGIVTPAPPLSLLPCVGCHHVRQTHTPAHRSPYTGLYAMIWGGGETEKWLQTHVSCGIVRHVG